MKIPQRRREAKPLTLRLLQLASKHEQTEVCIAGQPEAVRASKPPNLAAVAKCCGGCAVRAECGGFSTMQPHKIDIPMKSKRW